MKNDERKIRAEKIHKRLNELYPDPPIPLAHSDAFTMLVAVVLSAQCTDERVNLITPDLFKVAGTPQEMAALPLEKIEDLIRSCGLFRRKSVALKKLAQQIVERFDGNVPGSIGELETLPGVGHKTASVVEIHIHKRPAFPVDTHIHRLAQVWELTSGKNVRETEEDLKSLFPEKDWEKLHLQIIYYGREVCPARSCNGLRCDLCRELFPERKDPISVRKP